MDRRKFLQTGAALVAGTMLSRSIHATENRTTGTFQPEKIILPGTPLWQWSASELAHGIRAGDISSYEAVSSCFSRIDQVNPKLNAIVVLIREKALKNARLADKIRGQGKTLPPLHGVPISVKCNVDVSGEVNSSGGVRTLMNNVAKENSPEIQSMVNAGAIIVGLSNCPEFAFRWFTENPSYGRTLNPRNAEITPGGSSGGAASSVAAGMVPIGHGNDIAGSVRYPAYVCGVVGMRPTAGRVASYNASSHGGKSFAGQFIAMQGPLTRTVADNRLALQAMSGGSYLDPNWVNVPLNSPGDVPEVVGMVTELEGVNLSPDVIQSVKKAGMWLSKAGYEVVEIQLPDFQKAMDTWLRIVMTEMKALSLWEKIQQDGSPEVINAVRGMLSGTPETSMAQYMMAIATRDDIRRSWGKMFSRYPAVIMPVSAQPPMYWGSDQKGDEAMRHMLNVQSPLMAVAVTGFPAISVPTGLDRNKLPEGVQIIADSFREDICYNVASVIERAAGMPDAFGLGI
ncbi:amidase [Salmonella enterica subsp. houtenae]|nr:amidase [Salmonella enterica subsp. houtenae]